MRIPLLLLLPLISPLAAITPEALLAGPFNDAFPRGRADAERFLQGLDEALQLREDFLRDRARAASDLARLNRRFVTHATESLQAVGRPAPSDAFSLSHEMFTDALEGTGGTSAIEAFASFAGEWFGRWDQSKVDHTWHSVIDGRQIVGEIELHALQYAWVGDGFGWNIVAAAPGSETAFVLGTVYHVQDGDLDHVTRHRPHVGIAVDAEKLIWVTRNEVFLEERLMFEERPAYAITGFSYGIEHERPTSSKAFQAIYTRDRERRPPWHAFPFVPNARPPIDDDDLRYWLENMVWHHGFSTEEIVQATGLSREAIDAALRRWEIRPATKLLVDDSRLTVLPYPGGRHPRIGFLDGAIEPQRETKISVFTPWDPSSYVVADIPEALWSNLGLTYLAHTHVDTIWTKAGVALPHQEWERLPGGILRLRRVLPNGIAITSWVAPRRDHLLMRMTLHNGSAETLSDLRVQNCVMLKGAKGFTAQTNDNKVLHKPFVACHAAAPHEDRWIITAWEPCDRAWANPPVPCLHADPKFPECPPGETRELHGWLSFYEGKAIEKEFERIAGEWQKPSGDMWEAWIQPDASSCAGRSPEKSAK